MKQKTKDRNQLFGLVARTAFPPLLLCALPFGSGTASPRADPSSNRKTRVVDLLKGLETGDTTAPRVINPDSYTQHNPRVSDGLPGFLDAVKRLDQMLKLYPDWINPGALWTSVRAVKT